MPSHDQREMDWLISDCFLNFTWVYKNIFQEETMPWFLLEKN